MAQNFKKANNEQIFRSLVERLTKTTFRITSLVVTANMKTN